MLINLYNQARREEAGFKKIDEFETLYKQIGCGKKKSTFETLQNDSDVKELLQNAKNAGDLMFNETLPEFIQFLKFFVFNQNDMKVKQFKSDKGECKSFGISIFAGEAVRPMSI